NGLPDQLPHLKTPRRHPLATVLVLDDDRTVLADEDQVRGLLDRHAIDNEANIRRSVRGTDHHEPPPGRESLVRGGADDSLESPAEIFLTRSKEGLVEGKDFCAPRGVRLILDGEVWQGVEVRKAQTWGIRRLRLQDDLVTAHPSPQRFAEMDWAR